MPELPPETLLSCHEKSAFQVGIDYTLELRPGEILDSFRVKTAASDVGQDIDSAKALRHIADERHHFARDGDVNRQCIRFGAALGNFTAYLLGRGMSREFKPPLNSTKCENRKDSGCGF